MLKIEISFLAERKSAQIRSSNVPRFPEMFKNVCDLKVEGDCKEGEQNQSGEQERATGGQIFCFLSYMESIYV